MTFKRKLRSTLLIGVTASLVVAGCSRGSTSNDSSTGGAGGGNQGGSGDGGSSVGVTDKEVTVGNVSVQGGPIPGLFQGAPFAVDAYFAYINSKGGVNGRKLVLKQGDDAYSCTQNKSQTQELKDSVLAFVGNFSVYDNCAEDLFKADKTLPDVSNTIADPAMIKLPNVFSASPAVGGGQEGPLKWFLQQHPEATKIGTMVTNNPGAVNTWEKNFTPLLQSLGFSIVYRRDYQATETDFTSDVIRMKSAGVNFVYTPAMTPQAFGRLLQAAQQQGWEPIYKYNGSAYTASFDKMAPGGAGEGAVYASINAPFLEGANSTYDSVKLMTQWMNTTHPGIAIDNYAAAGWANAALFVAALEKAGQQPTRQSLLKALGDIHDFDAGGFQPKVDVGGKKPPECYLIFQFTKGAWKTIGNPAPQGYQCDPGGYFVSQG